MQGQVEYGVVFELYDVSGDEAEKYDLARAHLDVVKKIRVIMDREHVDHPNWHVPAAR